MENMINEKKKDTVSKANISYPGKNGTVSKASIFYPRHNIVSFDCC